MNNGSSIGNNITKVSNNTIVNNSMSLKKNIIIVASPNVQNNFKVQLFDER